MKLSTIHFLLVAALSLLACSGSAPSPREMTIGPWRATQVYGASQVNVEFHPDVSQWRFRWVYQPDDPIYPGCVADLYFAANWHGADCGTSDPFDGDHLPGYWDGCMKLDVLRAIGVVHDCAHRRDNSEGIVFSPAEAYNAAQFYDGRFVRRVSETQLFINFIEYKKELCEDCDWTVIADGNSP